MDAVKKTIELTNLGPIEGTFKIELDGPGLYELRGDKGSGKSTVLSAIDMLAGHSVTLTVHDGEKRGGVSGFGVVVPVGSRKRRRGELEVDTIESGKFDIADVIDPIGKTPETRDKQRIKALASLTGLRLSLSNFYGLIGGQGETEALAIPHDDDPVTLCSRVKTAIESEARRMEGLAHTEKGHADELMAQCEGVDLTGEHDCYVLQERYNEARDKHRQLEENLQRHKAQVAEQNQAKQQIESLEKSYDGPSVDEAQKAWECSKEVFATCQDALAAAQTNYDAAKNELEKQTLKLRAAADFAKAVAGWKETVEKSVLPPPLSESIEQAKADAEAALLAIERGLWIRTAKKAKAEAVEHAERCGSLARMADDLRAKARSVFDVLSQKLQTKQIFIEAHDGEARLFVQHPKRGKCYFDHVDGLSDGERVLTAISELLPHIQSPGVLAINQRVYQELPTSDHKKLAVYAKQNDLYLFGGRVTDSQLEIIEVCGTTD